MKDSVSTSIKDCEEAVGEGLKKVSKMLLEAGGKESLSCRSRKYKLTTTVV